MAISLNTKNYISNTIHILLLLLLLAIAAQSGLVHAAQDGTENVTGKVIAVPNPATDLWRAVRQREGSSLPATTQIDGLEANLLIADSGQKFRNLRSDIIIPYLPYLMAATAGIIFLFYLLRGSIGISDGRAGKSVIRFKKFERKVHWFTAILFIYLALTGLLLQFGKFVIAPLLGKDVFGVIASFSKETHDLVGPLFFISLVFLFVIFVSRNFPAKGDLNWMLKGGGFGKTHVKAGFFNTGEKIWFWLVILLGLTVSITGLIMDFPLFDQGRTLMQLSLSIHGIAAIVFISVSFGHIYLATIGTEGTLRGMTTGKVDVNWAKTHHDLWLMKLDDAQIETDEIEPAQVNKDVGTGVEQTLLKTNQ